MSAAFAVGFHGKVPARGDFVGHGLPHEVLALWDAWLSRALSDAARRLGPGWEALFQAAPTWRFVLAAGLCGNAPLAGVLMPSADRVGRLYPFTILAALPDTANPAVVPVACASWFDRAETVASDACRAGADVEALPARMAILGRPELRRTRAGGGWAARSSLVDSLVGPLALNASLWWCRGGGLVEPSMVTCPGLPRGSRPTAFLDGDWTRWGWADCDAECAVG